MRVAVTVAVYNEEKLIGGLIDALLAQTRRADEIVLVDDGSTDRTADVLQSLAALSPEIKVIRQQNGGPAAARNRAWQTSTADICVFTDGDCVPRRDWLEKLILPFEDPSIGAVGGAYYTVNTTSVLARFIGWEIAWRYREVPPLSDVDAHGSYNLAVRRSLLEQTGGYNEEYKKPSGEDWDLTYRISCRHRIVFAPAAVVGHYHPERFWPYMRNQGMRAFDRVRLYNAHPGKRTRDSYTGSLAKYQVLSIPLLIAAVAGWAVLGASVWVPVAALLLNVVLSWRLFAYVARRDLSAMFYAVPVIACRNVAWFIGLLKGIATFGLKTR